jgi:exodeoxyribonuclease VII large subunit
MQVRPEEGMEVVATGRMTTFPGQSKYQLIVEDVAPAGAGALMAMLEKRRAALQAEGLFDPARKKPIPYLPGVIGVITSPSGAVIRDILHRLRDRFPRPVLIWPVAVQGQILRRPRWPPRSAASTPFRRAADPAARCDDRGARRRQPRGSLGLQRGNRGARGGGLGDPADFSAVGHETDTTLIDHAADLRAPTPTAAAELAVPVRLELIATVEALSARLLRAVSQGIQGRGQRLRDLSRALPRPEALTGAAAQRLDGAAGRLAGALGLMGGGWTTGRCGRRNAGMRPLTNGPRGWRRRWRACWRGPVATSAATASGWPALPRGWRRRPRGGWPIWRGGWTSWTAPARRWATPRRWPVALR